MTSTLLLIDLLGAAALLLWGLRLLKAGVNRAFGMQLRGFLATSTRNRLTAFGAGFLTTLALQSSTAMALMVSSFVAQGLITTMMAQAVMLGANVGTAVVTQVLALDIHWLAPVAILAGVTVGARKSRRSGGLGEIAIGLGIMLLSLKLMSEASAPMRASEALAAFFALLGGAPVIAVIIAAALATVSASSLAVVLFVMALATAGSIDATLCVLLVAGANLGGALPPVMVVAAEGVAASRVAISNLAVRALGTLVLLFAIGWTAPYLDTYGDLPGLVVWVHLLFNITLAVVFLPLIGLLTRVLTAIMPDKPNQVENGPRHLDETALSDLPAALAAATRETLRVGDIVETMLETSLNALRNNDEQLCQSVLQLDNQVDRLQSAIKFYLAQLNRSLDDASQRQANFILDYAINLEHVGDIIEGSLSRLTLKKIEKHLQYSPEGMREIEGLFLGTLDNLHLAQGVFLSRDPHMARRLMESKLTVRRKERESVDRHMARLHDQRPDTVQTTSMHMDVLRDLKRINDHLISVAAPILEEAGLLRKSRLRKA